MLHGADSIWRKTWSYSPVDFRHAMIARIREDADFNQRAIHWKATALRVALVLTALEVAAVVVAVLEARLR